MALKQTYTAMLVGSRVVCRLRMTDVCVHIGVDKQLLQTTDSKKERASNNLEPLMKESRIFFDLFDQRPFYARRAYRITTAGFIPGFAADRSSKLL